MLIPKDPHIGELPKPGALVYYVLLGIIATMESRQEFHPELTSRTGERNAWILAGVAVAAYLLIWRVSEPSTLLLITVGFLLLSATFISLSNWIDRKTILVLAPEGVKFRNGLRNVTLNWDEIEKLRVVPDRWGKRVHVSSSQTYFSFRNLSDVKFQGKVRGQMGFPEGEAILQQILQSSGLVLTEENDQGHYYARPVGRVARP